MLKNFQQSLTSEIQPVPLNEPSPVFSNVLLLDGWIIWRQRRFHRQVNIVQSFKVSIATVSFMTRSRSPCSCSQGQVNVNDSLPLICGSLQLLPVFCASLCLGANVARSQTPRLSKQLTSGSVYVWNVAGSWKSGAEGGGEACQGCRKRCGCEYDDPHAGAILTA